MSPTQREYIAYLPDGKILDVGPDKYGYTPHRKDLSIRKFVRIREPVKWFRQRVKSLYYLTMNIVEKGLVSNKAYKVLKRLNLVAFTCSRGHLRKMVNSIVRENNKTTKNTLAVVPEVSSWSNPFFTKETKSVNKLNGKRLHLWSRTRVKRVIPSPQDDEW